MGEKGEEPNVCVCVRDQQREGLSVRESETASATKRERWWDNHSLITMKYVSRKLKKDWVNTVDKVPFLAQTVLLLV